MTFKPILKPILSLVSVGLCLVATDANASKVWNRDASASKRFVTCHPPLYKVPIGMTDELDDAIWELDYNESVQVDTFFSRTYDTLYCSWFATWDDAFDFVDAAQAHVINDEYPYPWFDEDAFGEALAKGFAHSIMDWSGEVQAVYCEENRRAEYTTQHSGNVRVGATLSTEPPRDCGLDPDHDFPDVSLYTVAEDRLYVTDQTILSGTPINRLTETNWSNTAAMTSLGNMLYIVQGNSLWETDPANGSYRRLGSVGSWSNTAAMTAIDDMLYVIQGNTLWRANPNDGSYQQLGSPGAWSNTAAMTAIDGMLYVVQGGTLWRANPDNGSYQQLGSPGSWGDTAAMTAVNGLLYIVQGDTLWQAQPSNGQWLRIGTEDDWWSTVSMTTDDGWLYIVQNGTLWRVNPDNGWYAPVGLREDWRGTVVITAASTTACAHDVCNLGESLQASCDDPCAAEICSDDPFCCDPNGSWDALCVSAATSICNLSCG
ncbi:hypothetical protein [Enhygromyxa salina]|uniref:hypothetical protein n=1 Tax=Enhygromyxa salina TaxID=215803 RepID=UPI000697FC02|nr:hypothetical protein [Enhygromyxa salina]